jgi:hypothetical protein
VSAHHDGIGACGRVMESPAPQRCDGTCVVDNIRGHKRAARVKNACDIVVSTNAVDTI